MQARSDLLEGRLQPINWENSAEIAALLMQADKVKFEPTTLTCTPVEQQLKALTDTSASSLIDMTPSSSTMSTISRCRKRKLSKSKTSICELNFNETDSSSTVVHTPFTPYEKYVLRPSEIECNEEMPIGFTQQIAKEHSKLAALKMTSKNAKYWLLEKISKLSGFGEETFCGHLLNNLSTRCELSVGPHGIFVNCAEKKIR